MAIVSFEILGTESLRNVGRVKFRECYHLSTVNEFAEPIKALTNGVRSKKLAPNKLRPQFLKLSVTEEILEKLKR